MTLIKQVKESIDRAYKEESKLSQAILSIEGMSSPKNRHLLNNLLSYGKPNYLEIGVWKGSTFASALYGNEIESAYAIDNWKEFHEPGLRESFIRNIALTGKDYTLIEQDSFRVNTAKITNKVDIYFYDGFHSKEASFHALDYYYDVLADEFIYVVDDYDWIDVQAGVQESIRCRGLNVKFNIHLRAGETNDIHSWWNGIYIAILEKNGCK